MVLAAGLGTRLRPVTETIPKPLVEINGRTLLDHAIDRLALVGVERVVVNGDVSWLDSKDCALLRLADAFDAEDMDAVLLLQRTLTAVGYEGRGDYFLDPSAKPRRRGEREVAPYLFAGIQLLHCRLFDGMQNGVFSLVRLFDRAERAGRLRAIVHDGEWFHIGTPEGLAATRERLSSHRIER